MQSHLISWDGESRQKVLGLGKFNFFVHVHDNEDYSFIRLFKILQSLNCPIFTHSISYH